MWPKVTEESIDFPQADNYLARYQNPKEADAMTKIREDLDETKIILHNTIETVLQRGEKLDNIVSKAEGLSDQSIESFTSLLERLIISAVVRVLTYLAHHCIQQSPKHIAMAFQLIELPIEILTSIFKNLLGLEDRKNVRLTCSWLNYVCNFSLVTNNEKFVIHRHNKEYLNKCIPKCKTLRTHIEFHGLDFTEFKEIVWYHYGSHLQSLAVYNCYIDGSTFKNINVHCPKMTHFYYKYDYDDGDPRYVEFLSKDVINELLVLKIERKELVSFEMYHFKYYQSVIEDDSLDKINWENFFLLYPCIRTFGESGIYKDGGNSLYDSIPSTVENLTSIGHWEPGIFSCQKQGLNKFKQLSINVATQNEEEDLSDMLKFFSNQSELESLELSFQDAVLYSSDAVIALLQLFDALRKSPKLRKFKYDQPEEKVRVEVSTNHFRTNADFNNFFKLIPALPSLSFVRKNFNLEDNFGKLQIHTPPSEHYANSVKKLCLYYSRSKEKFHLEILNQFSADGSLEHLELPLYGKLNNYKLFIQKVLQIDSLRTLKIGIHDKNDIMNPQISWANLKNLKHLSLSTYPEILENLSLESLPANLKCLEIELHNYNSFDKTSFKIAVWIRTLDIVTLNLPHLAVLKIGLHINNLNQIELPKYCKRLTQLRFLTVSSRHDHKEDLIVMKRELFKKLFISCSSLRWIDDSWNDTSYSYDRFSAKLLSFSKRDIPIRIVQHDPFEPVYCYLE